MKITIGGKIGAGKTTTAKALSKYYSMPFISTGEIRRNMAKKRNITIEELNYLGETDPKTDLIPDRYQKIVGKSKKNFIIEGKLSWYFIPNSIKIFYEVDETVGAKRILKENRASEKKAKSLEKQIKLNEERTASDIFRYKKIYNIENYFDHSHYDFIINTTNLTKQQVLKKTISLIQNV